MPRELLKRALPKLRRLQFANDSAVERLNALIEDIEAELSKPDQEPLGIEEIAAEFSKKDVPAYLQDLFVDGVRFAEKRHDIGVEK